MPTKARKPNCTWNIAAIRMGAQTSFGFLNLNDQAVQIKLTEGDVYFRIHNFDQNQVFEVDTPNAAVNLLRDGVYRFRVDPNRNMSFVVVRRRDKRKSPAVARLSR